MAEYTKAAESGVSVHVLLGQAIAADYLQRLQDALEVHHQSHVHRSPQPWSRELVRNHRRSCSGGHRSISPTDEATPTLYKLLLRASKCDETSHVAMAKYLDHNGKGEEALHILQAVTTTAPSSRDAWRMTEIIAKKLGKEELAAEAHAEALALGEACPCDVRVLRHPGGGVVQPNPNLPSMTTESTPSVDPEAIIQTAQPSFVFTSCVAYEPSPDSSDSPIFFPYVWTIETDDLDEAWETAFALVRAIGVQHGALALDGVDLEALPLDAMRHILLTAGIHLIPPSLTDPDEAAGE